MTTVEQDNDTRLEARMSAFESRMSAFESRMSAIEARVDTVMTILTEIRADNRETNRRIDRLFYTLVGIGGGIIAALIVMIIRSNPAG